MVPLCFMRLSLSEDILSETAPLLPHVVTTTCNGILGGKIHPLLSSHQHPSLMLRANIIKLEIQLSEQPSKNNAKEV